MTGEDVKVDAGVAEATATAYETPTRLEAALEGFGPKRVTAKIPRTRSEASAMGADALRERTAQRARRTAELLADGRTLRQIGEVIGGEEGLPAFPKDTVREWKREARRLGLIDY